MLLAFTPAETSSPATEGKPTPQLLFISETNK